MNQGALTRPSLQCPFFRGEVPARSLRASADSAQVAPDLAFALPSFAGGVNASKSPDFAAI